MITRVNIGTFKKKRALNIREKLNFFRKKENFPLKKVILRSRTYGNKNNSHDRTMPVNKSKRLAVYLDLIHEENEFQLIVLGKLLEIEIKKILRGQSFQMNKTGNYFNRKNPVSLINA